MADKFDFDQMVKAMQCNAARKEAELQRLTQDPALHEVAQALMDELLRCLDALFNFHHVVDGRGNVVSVLAVHEALRAGVLSTFHQLTGDDYVPPVCRTVRFSEQQSKVNVDYPNTPTKERK
mgnify:CR=1 FL=1